MRRSGGAKQDRTADLLRARQALSQLSYSPSGYMLVKLLNKDWCLGHMSQAEHLVGLGRLELPTSPLSGVRSNQLSYRPISSEAYMLGLLLRSLSMQCV